MDNVINFFSRKQEFRSLSNFWEGDVKVQGRLYESGEHCFHGEKYYRLADLSTDLLKKALLLDYSQLFMKPSYRSAAEAKTLGSAKGFRLTKEELAQWSRLSVEVQKEICRWKFENYKEVRDDLIKSGSKILIHPAMRCSHVESRIWEGKASLKYGELVVLGQNILGKIWMELRSLSSKTLSSDSSTTLGSRKTSPETSI
jgi:ribA/ribD-fused uncharacterized protein